MPVQEEGGLSAALVDLSVLALCAQQLDLCA